MHDGGLVQMDVVIVGAGFGGLGLGIRLKQRGLNGFVILERSDHVGGVWRQNRYPGAECDVPSHLYSFSFELRSDWPERYASQPDILDYLTHCARKSRIEAQSRFGAEVVQAHWEQTSRRWIVETSDGRTFSARALISATGQLSRPLHPDLPGLASFAGTAFHSAAWRNDCELVGKRVAVIGTGASAIQLVPMIAPLAHRLFVFQRSAAYVFPKSNKPYARWQKKLFGRLPAALRLSRLLIYLQHEMTAFAFVSLPGALRFKRFLFRRHLRREIAGEELRNRLTPDYYVGCKRILLSNTYYAAIGRPNVELVTKAIGHVRPDAIVTSDGIERKVDAIIFATGFAATDFLAPIRIVGPNGRQLHDVWRGEARAYLGIAMPGFPNFFMLYGPNTNLGHNSVIYMIESQISHVLACIERLLRDPASSIEIRPEVERQFQSRTQQRLQKTVWAKGCSTWYQTATGKNTANWPGYTFEYRRKVRTPNWKHYVVR